jgi:hypothetical protein
MTLLFNNKIPRNRVLELEAAPMRIEGWVTVQLGRNLDGKKGPPIILRELKFKNLIVNGGLDLLGSNSTSLSSTFLNYIAVGTGSTAPANTDAGLVSETGVRTNSNGGFADVTGFGPANAYAFLQHTRLFTEAQSNGNLTELGFFTASTSGTMWMRQLFKDGTGTPTTVVKTASDQLKIIYEMRIYPPSADVVNTITISGTLYTYTHRAANIGASPWSFASMFQASKNLFAWSSSEFDDAYETATLGTTAGAPSGTNATADSLSFSTYSAGNYYRDKTSKWEPATGNFGTGIGATTVNIFNTGARVPMFQTSWSPKFTKDNTKRLTLVTRLSWARH